MSKGPLESKYLSTGLDWSTTGFTEAEAAKMNKWYVDTHGVGNLDLVKFVPFMSELRPDAMKAYRRSIETTVGARLDGAEGMENSLGPVSVLMWLHTYCILAYPQGILYEIICSRTRGATKAEVADTITVAWLHSGTFGINTVAEVAADYMRSWDAADGASGIQWPAGWARDPEAFSSGLDFSDVTTISDAELRRLSDWHRRVQGEVPAYVGFFAKNYPAALKVFRARYENAMMNCSLPKQMIPILQTHIAAIRRSPEGVRRSVHMAKEFGVRKGQVIQCLAIAHRFLGDLFMDAAIDPAAEVLEAWS